MDPRDPAIVAAQALEKKGDARAAAAEFMKAGAPAEAVRVLTTARLFTEAAQLLLTANRIDPDNALGLDAEQRKHGLTAAILLGRGGDTERAVKLFVSLGEVDRAADLLRRSGDAVAASTLKAGAIGAANPVARHFTSETGVAPVPSMRTQASIDAARRAESEGRHTSALDLYLAAGSHADAGRVLKRLGRFAEAAQRFMQAGQPYDAAKAFFEGNAPSDAFDVLAKTSREDARYRRTCVHAISVASETGLLTFSLEHFLGPFLSAGPGGPDEAAAFYQLAALYEAKALAESAVETFRRLLLYDGRYKDAAARLKRLSAAAPLVTGETLQDESLPPPLRSPGRAPAERPRAEPPPSEAQSAPRAGTFAVGALIASRYRLKAQLGSGGMGVVFRATDLELGVDIALKAYLGGEHEARAIGRFRQEMRLARSIVHENVIRVFDLGVHDNARYLTMELLEGSELRDLIQDAMPMTQALDYLIQACRGLHAAHEQGVVHRDVKPANLFVTKRGLVKVMDFGIARTLGAPADLTRTGTFAGTANYIAPEQIRHSSAVTPAADLYSLGVVAYRTLTGVLPFDAPDQIPILMMHLEQPPAPLREHNPQIPRGLENVVLRCLAKQPEERWASCAELADQLGHFKT
jgi:serine/threonine-protein kinase